MVWTTALLAFFAVTSGSISGFSLGAASRLERGLQTYTVGRAALPYVKMLLESDVTPRSDGFIDPFLSGDSALFTGLQLGEGTLNIYYETRNADLGIVERFDGIMDEERKLNLNKADMETLANLFHLAGGLDYPEAAAAASKVADWRDEDNQKLDEGAEKYDYQSLKEPYECKNGPFQSVEELLLVYDMTPELYLRVRPYLTVYGTGKVNLNTADETVLLALGISETGVNGLLLYRSGEDAEDRTEDDLVLASLPAIAAELSAYVPAEDLNRIQNLVNEEQLDIYSDVFSFYSEAAMTEPDSSYKIHAVVHRTGEVLSWQEI